MTPIPRSGRLSPEAGLTLVELMVAGLVSALVVAVVFQVMATGATLFQSQASVSEMQMGGRFGLTLLSQDLANAGYGATTFCESGNNKDPLIVDPAQSCDPWQAGPGMRAIYFIDAASNNGVYQPDEVWVLTNPYPGKVLPVASLAGGVLTIETDNDPVTPSLSAAETETILRHEVLLIENRGARSFRAGGSSAFTRSGATYTLTLSPPPSSGASTVDEIRGFGGSDTQVSAVAWIRYYVDGGSRLLRAVYDKPDDDAPDVAVVVDDVVDFQVSFCRDAAYDPFGTPGAATIECDVTDQDAVNDEPHKLRTATIVLRTRTKSEDPSAYASQGFDLDGNPQNGVARVRTFVRSVRLASLWR